jgi:hypothetical protein
MIHLLSNAIMFFIQKSIKSLIIAVHAAQSQFTTTFSSSFFFQVIFNQLISQANTTIAVPC